MNPVIAWPDGCRFAFTIFDDPDAQTLAAGRAMYSFLQDMGFRTTKAVWLMEPRERNSSGETCQSRDFLEFALSLQKRGFEIGYHNGAPGNLRRDEIIRSLDLFREYFGHNPLTMANHYNEDAIYWGAARLGSLAARAAYCATRLGRKDQFFGHVPGHPSFWGDICRERIGYCRNFVFRDVNTLAACPWMPYVDPKRPYVARWFASSEGANCASFLRQLSEPGQDRLEQQGGACIMYAHFGHHFVDGSGRVHSDFKRLMQRLAHKRGWFVPVGTLLEYIRSQRGDHTLDKAERGRLERRWLAAKLFHGTS